MEKILNRRSTWKVGDLVLVNDTQDTVMSGDHSASGGVNDVVTD